MQAGVSPFWPQPARNRNSHREIADSVSLFLSSSMRPGRLGVSALLALSLSLQPPTKRRQQTCFAPISRSIPVTARTRFFFFSGFLICLAFCDTPLLLDGYFLLPSFLFSPASTSICFNRPQPPPTVPRHDIQKSWNPISPPFLSNRTEDGCFVDTAIERHAPKTNNALLIRPSVSSLPPTSCHYGYGPANASGGQRHQLRGRRAYLPVDSRGISRRCRCLAVLLR